MYMSQIHCCGGNIAEDICCSVTCDSSKGALICLKQDCQCNTLHKECSLNFPLKKLFRALNQKGKSYLPILQRLVCFYDNVIKLMTIQKENIFKIMQEYSLALDRQNREFYLKLKRGQNILAKEVINTVNSLLNKPQYDLQLVKNRLDDHEMLFQNCLNNMVVCLEKYQKFRPAYQIIVQQQNNNTIKPENHKKKTGIQTNTIIKCRKTIEKWRSFCYHYKEQVFISTFTPDLTTSNLNKCRSFKFQIKRFNYRANPYATLIFGIYIKNLAKINKTDQQVDSSDLISEGKSQNFFALASNKKIYCNGETTASEISMQQNDIIKLDFDPLNKRIVFTKNNHQYTVVNMQYSDKDQLALFVGFQEEGQEVQYFGQYDEFGKKIWENQKQ